MNKNNVTSEMFATKGGMRQGRDDSCPSLSIILTDTLIYEKCSIKKYLK